MTPFPTRRPCGDRRSVVGDRVRGPRPRSGSVPSRRRGTRLSGSGSRPSCSCGRPRRGAGDRLDKVVGYHLVHDAILRLAERSMWTAGDPGRGGGPHLPRAARGRDRHGLRAQARRLPGLPERRDQDREDQAAAQPAVRGPERGGSDAPARRSRGTGQDLLPEQLAFHLETAEQRFVARRPAKASSMTPLHGWVPSRARKRS